EGAGRHLAAEAGLVAVARGDVHHGAHPATVLGVEARGVDVGVADDVVVEHAEQTDAVKGVVQHHAVHHHLVHDGRAAPHVELATLVTSEYHPGHHLEVLGQVGLTAHGGHALD